METISREFFLIFVEITTQKNLQIIMKEEVQTFRKLK